MLAVAYLLLGTLCTCPFSFIIVEIYFFIFFKRLWYFFPLVSLFFGYSTFKWVPLSNLLFLTFKPFFFKCFQWLYLWHTFVILALEFSLSLFTFLAITGVDEFLRWLWFFSEDSLKSFIVPLKTFYLFIPLIFSFY